MEARQSKRQTRATHHFEAGSGCGRRIVRCSLWYYCWCCCGWWCCVLASVAVRIFENFQATGAKGPRSTNFKTVSSIGKPTTQT